MVYGMPFIFYENREANDVNEILRVMNKMDRIYMEESHINYYDLIHRECFINGPATYISKRLLTDSRVKESLLEYKYTDDYPQWIKMSEIKDVSFKYIPFVSVIYRRTSESAYIVRSGELLDERIKVFNYAKSTSRNIIEKLFVNSSLNNMYRMRKGKKPHKFEAINFLHEIYNIKNGKRKCRYTKKIINNTFEYIERIKLME